MNRDYKEAIKIYDGLTYIDEDLIEEMQSFLKANTTRTLKGKLSAHNKIMRLAIATVCIIFAFASVVIIGVFRGERVNWRELLTVEMGGALDVIIGKRDENGKIVLEEEVIKEATIDYSILATMEEYFQNEGKYEEVAQRIETVVGDVTSEFLIANAGEICISKHGMPIIYLNSNAVLEIYYFLFVNDRVVGYLLFFEHDGKVDYTIHLYTEDVGGIYSDYLTANQGKAFVAIGDGRGHIYFLSEENIVIKPSTGSEDKSFTVVGDCYNEFSDNVKISFEKISEETIKISR